MPRLTPLERDHHATEMIDRPASPEAIAGCLDVITRLNGLFGGRWITLRHVRRLLRARPAHRPVIVLDVGAGAADIPVTLVRWARRRGRALRVFALDRGRATLTYARAYTAAYPEITLIEGDALALPVRPESVDIVISAMTLHHLGPEEAVRYLAEIDGAARRGWVVNDLVRGRIAHGLVWLLTRLTRSVTRPRSLVRRSAASISRPRPRACWTGWPSSRRWTRRGHSPCEA